MNITINSFPNKLWVANFKQRVNTKKFNFFLTLQGGLLHLDSCTFMPVYRFGSKTAAPNAVSKPSNNPHLQIN